MNRTLLILAIAGLTGCATCQKYPTTCAVVTFVAVGSIAMAAATRDAKSVGRTPDYTMPLLPDCGRFPESCK